MTGNHLTCDPRLAEISLHQRSLRKNNRVLVKDRDDVVFGRKVQDKIGPEQAASPGNQHTRHG